MDRKTFIETNRHALMGIVMDAFTAGIDTKGRGQFLAEAMRGWMTAIDKRLSEYYSLLAEKPLSAKSDRGSI